MHPLGARAGRVAASVWDRDDATRVTRVGRSIRRLRLDELPQFWNIVKGDMDLVGPRPEMLANVQAMTEQIPYYSLRLSVRPGLDGLGPDPVRLLGQPRAGDREDSLRPVLHQAHVGLAGPADPRGYGEDRSVRPRGQVGR